MASGESKPPVTLGVEVIRSHFEKQYGDTVVKLRSKDGSAEIRTKSEEFGKLIVGKIYKLTISEI